MSFIFVNISVLFPQDRDPNVPLCPQSGIKAATLKQLINVFFSSSFNVWQSGVKKTRLPLLLLLLWILRG